MSIDHCFACIIIDDEPMGQGGFVLQPILIANQPVLLRQIALLRAAGFSEILVLGRHNNLQPLAQWEGIGPIGIVSSVPELLERMPDNQSVLLMGEGSLPSAELLNQMRAVDGGAILVRDAATSDDRHERIDLNDRFAGLLMMPKSALDNLPAMDVDWSLLSMILRHAVQLNIARLPIPIGPTEPVRCDVVASVDDAAKWQFRALEFQIAEQSATASPLRRWLLLPLAQLVLPTLWSNGAPIMPYVPYVSLFLGAVALFFGWMAWPVTALIFLAFSYVCQEIVGQARHFSMASEGETAWAHVGIILIFPLWVLLWSSSMPSSLSAFLAGAAVSLAFLQQIFGGSPTSSIWFGPVEAMVLAIVAIIAGLSVGTTALLITAIVLLQNVWRPLAMRLKTI